MENNKLQKNLGFAAALSTVVGMVIGGGVFFKPQAVYTATGGAPGLGMIAWVIAGVMTIAAGLTAAEISAAIPKTGLYRLFAVCPQPPHRRGSDPGYLPFGMVIH